MASITQNKKDGKVISYKFKACVGRDEFGKTDCSVRQIPLMPSVAALLLEFRDSTDWSKQHYLFPKENEPLMARDPNSVTKQVSRFARNVLDSLNYIFMLRKLDPPVGVYFETEKLNTLDRSSDMVITVLSLVAQSESEQKSNSLKWSFKRRRAQGLGIYPNWSLLGYKGHNWEIDEDEADVVRTIYSLYLEGYSSTQIADLLTKSGILTVKGLNTLRKGFQQLQVVNQNPQLSALQPWGVNV